ncbi:MULTISPECIES: RNA polymerase sigma factor [unclassified Microbacterium]|uniref:RNA polymerase sigma factor n=1 Tax=unclassified Microbacterium TaxID=2609290 RepID=UPI001604BE7A|nr:MULTISPECIES: RNA polymerase sigma factor [unclassified Microbacterium]QNA91806.1 RNA polymerase sigma factor [Microbacterium sp. Se63.02b]QYM65008.1 RNA polymerase sigma factor [Microbacterium sp. Se5.02b]
MPEDSGAAARGVLSELITAEPDRLRRRSISLGVPVDDAEDAAQTSLLRAWRSIAHLETPEPGRVCSWLDAIARNVAIDLARQRARRPQAVLEDDTAGEQAGVDAAVEIRVFLDGALGALHALPETVREPLLLSVVDGLSAEQIATRLGIEPAAARQRISRGRKAMKACRRSGMGES